MYVEISSLMVKYVDETGAEDYRKLAKDDRILMKKYRPYSLATVKTTSSVAILVRACLTIVPILAIPLCLSPKLF